MKGKLPVAGATINYEVWSDGEELSPTKSRWITLVNGYSRPLGDFRAMGRFLSEAGFQVLVFDNRGVGDTEVSRAFTLEEAAYDILRLWESLGITSSALLGISLGGTLAMTQACARPEPLKGLIVCSSSARWDLVKIEREPENYFSPGFFSSHEVLVRSLIKEIGNATKDPNKKKGAEFQRRAMGSFDITDKLHQIQVPTLVLHGTQDRIVVPQAAKTTAELIPKATLEYFEGAGHLFLAECPRRFYSRVSQFLNDEVFHK